jgi:hypothetical protein
VRSIKLIVPLVFLVLGGVVVVRFVSGAQPAHGLPEAAPEAKVTQLISKTCQTFLAKKV